MKRLKICCQVFSLRERGRGGDKGRESYEFCLSRHTKVSPAQRHTTVSSAQRNTKVSSTQKHTVPQRDTVTQTNKSVPCTETHCPTQRHRNTVFHRDTKRLSEKERQDVV